MTIMELRELAESTENDALIAALKHIDYYSSQMERLYKERDALNVALSQSGRVLHQFHKDINLI